MTDYWRGVGKVTDSILDVRKRTREGAREGGFAAGTNVLNVSNSQVPHEEGDLERDGNVSMDDGPLLRVAISYGHNADTRKYAEVQHEDMTLKHDAGRNAKFLENALNSTRQQSLELIGAGIKRRLNA